MAAGGGDSRRRTCEGAGGEDCRARAIGPEPLNQLGECDQPATTADDLVGDTFGALTANSLPTPALVPTLV